MTRASGSSPRPRTLRLNPQFREVSACPPPAYAASVQASLSKDEAEPSLRCFVAVARTFPGRVIISGSARRLTCEQTVGVRFGHGTISIAPASVPCRRVDYLSLRSWRSVFGRRRLPIHGVGLTPDFADGRIYEAQSRTLSVRPSAHRGKAPLRDRRADRCSLTLVVDLHIAAPRRWSVDRYVIGS